MRLWTAGVCSTSISDSLIVIASDDILAGFDKTSPSRPAGLEDQRRANNELGTTDMQATPCHDALTNTAMGLPSMHKSCDTRKLSCCGTRARSC